MVNNNPTGINQYTKGGGKVSSLQKSRAKIRKAVGMYEKVSGLKMPNIKAHGLKGLTSGARAKNLSGAARLLKSVKK